MPRKVDFSKIYYHGTKTDNAAKGILKKGIQPPDVVFKQQLSPVKGKVYLTSNLKYALLYAIGANMIGKELPSSFIKPGTEYAYLFVISGKELKDIQPDEDFIGEMIWKVSFGKPHPITGDFPSSYTDSYTEPEDYSDFDWLYKMAEKELTSKQFLKVLDGEYAYWATAGKKLVKKMTDDQKWKLIDAGAHIAHTGSLKIKEAWKMHKNDNVKLKKDGSNFFKVAKRIN